ncbi:MAG TPA: zf-HC2 domain-containing protein [Gammaproteobacteria bacterium]|nr:zf-HC2 domain-containing protein [Gammaproteobacteria bacterium]
MLRCKDIGKLSSDYIDNNLSPIMRLKIKIHLFMCHHCRDFIRQFSLTVEALNDLKAPLPENKRLDEQVYRLLAVHKKQINGKHR